ncbi:AAA family ATPase, partial [Vannielia sp.]|uniref:nSTAND1 domain-containing NTPase n=1 Tax=Vannielia sp. TaxID=2813045 RepID=UPI00261CB3A7
MADIDETAGRPEIKIFLSSPGDVNEERILADRVMKRLAERYASVAHLVPIVWEHEPLLATATFQDQIEKPSTTDIVICILWSRLGTRLPAHIQRDDGSRYDSGTEFEFEDAWDAIQRTGRPDLLVYRKMAEPYISLANDHDAEERLHQKRALDGFIQKWFHDQDGSLLAAFHGFSDSAEFEEAFEIHLDKLIARRLDELGVVFTNHSGAVETSGGPRWEGSPFRGLESFEFAHAPIFYGRTQAISKVLKALRGQAASGQSFVMVLGRSGGGKSSLVRAGVLPLLVEPGVVEGVGLWRRAVFRPSDASGNLVEAFAKALTNETALPELLSDGTTVAELADLLSTTPQGADLLLKGALSEAAQKAAFDLAEEAEALARKSHVSEAERAKRKQDVLGNPPQAKLALLVDQLEELFTDEHLAAAERQAFLQAIA